MPELISVPEFLHEAWDDFNSPTTSSFVHKMGQCRHTVASLEETLDMDRSGVTKMKKSVKALYNSGITHVGNEEYLAENLEKLGATRDQETELEKAFLKFSIVTKDLSQLMRSLMQSLNNIVLFPLDAFLKGDLKGIKGDLKKPFDKAWKDYDAKFSKIEKEKKQQAKEVGMVRTEVSGNEIAEEMEKERRMFQLQMCEYLIKVNEIKTKKGADLLQHLVEYYKAQTNFFQDGIKTIDHYNSYVEDLVSKLQVIKQRQDQERRKLIELREALKSTLTTYKEILDHGRPTVAQNSSSQYNLHQLQGNKAHGCEKQGYLLKKSEGRMRKVWQRRRCSIKAGFMSISHSDESKDPVRLNLLTCQVKLVPEDQGKKCFDLVSSLKNRTYHFQGEDLKDMEEWISVLNNAKEEVLMKAFQDSSNSPSMNQSVRELTTSIKERIKRLPGNRFCCDCGAPDPEWLSTNLGVLVCLECVGIHREMGVHISRTQSMVIDELSTSQLLLARVVGNTGFNDIMEATLHPSQKPDVNSPMEQKRNFIKAKYEGHKYAIITCTYKEDLKQDLQQAIQYRDVFALLQVYAEGIDLTTTLHNMPNEETALHLAVSQEQDGTALHMVDFIIQNSNILDKCTRDGNTALHLCAALNRTECMKLLLRSKPEMVTIENKEGKTALDIANENNHELCSELLRSALAGKKEAFECVNIDWELIPDDHMYDHVDYSDDDLEGTPDKKSRSRPPSLINFPTDMPPHLAKELGQREKTGDQDAKLPPPPPPASNKPKKYVTIPGYYRDKSRTFPGLNAPANGGTTNQTHSANHHANNLTNHVHSLGQGHVGSGQVSGPPLPPRVKAPKKAPAPKPPGHMRNLSEPNAAFLLSHKRTPSDPPPRPSKPDPSHRNTVLLPPGAKFVLPPRPEFPLHHVDSGSGKPSIAPRYQRTQSMGEKDATCIRRPILRDSQSSSEGSPPESHFPPVPQPRAKKKPGRRRCRALYHCTADNEDELSFQEGEIIVIIREEEEDWWEGEIEGDPNRRGLFPVSFVHILND
ncbi:arf-GAP with SH3 domain, ANK repeat and PH domain-containing protein 2-like isoform X3 [Liolophura sinensis]|uniref:arf-GAP with SH3 domain, ANK repeat and PH domain-containing protein 2-like isoform X3 n=1 Tax=Liolophura sinensis TaxID=3198878 RepID=UPI0031581BAA